MEAPKMTKAPSVDVLAEMGFDPDDPEVVAAMEDADAAASLIETLVGLRSDLGLTQIEVGDRLGIRQPTVSDFERLGGDPRVSTVQRYARSLGAKVRFRVDATNCGDVEWQRMSSHRLSRTTWSAADDRVWKVPSPDKRPA